MRRTPWLLGALLLSAGAGCEGLLGDSPSSTAAVSGKDPGRVTMHRLNRVEYNNTVRDLLGTKMRPADDFPADDISYGFDNIADVLTTSPLHVELYERAAELLIEEAMAIPVPSKVVSVEAETLMGSAGVATPDAWNLYSDGEVSTLVAFPLKGQYKVSARVWGDQAGSEPAKASVLVGGVPIGQFDVPATSASPMVVEQAATIEPGSKVVAVEFLNDYYDAATQADRNLYVDWITVEGPLDAPPKNSQRDRIAICDPATGDACVRDIVKAFARRAWRRPLTQKEVDGLMSFVNLAKQEGDTVEEGLRLALRATLVSSNFVFRAEIDPTPTSLAPHPLNDFELASRLSYFLWSSMPDDELLAAAESGKLKDVAEIKAQVLRMLDDPRADALTDNFAGQWLYTRSLDDHEPDYLVYPAYDDALKEAFRTETKLFFRELLRGDHSMKELLTGTFTFANDKLAQHYGLSDALGPDFKKVSLEGTPRRGVLSQGSLLTVTSHPTRTSPVKRGKWVLSQLLCSEPPPPPPGVEGLKPDPMPTSTLREMLEQHRKDPICASCHAAMDPIGFGLENFDGIGAYRTDDTGGFAIDASGELPTGEKFIGAVEMADVLAGDARYPRCVTRQLYSYALGRGIINVDRDYIDYLTAQFVAGGMKLTDLIVLVATSDPFRLRRGEPAAAGSQ